MIKWAIIVMGNLKKKRKGDSNDNRQTASGMTNALQGEGVVDLPELRIVHFGGRHATGVKGPASN